MPRADSTYRAALRWRAFDTHGVITTADASELGVPPVALRQLARRGALSRSGYGVYRMLEVPPTPMSEYAEAIALVGVGSLIADESVLAIHDLALVSPRRIKVVHGGRSRAVLPPTVLVERRKLSPEEMTTVDGVPTMTVAAAILATRGRILASRLREALDDAVTRGLVDEGSAAALRASLAGPTVE